MLPKILLILSLVTLSGCASMEAFENRLAVTVAGDELLFVSKYGPVGVATPISAKDLTAVRPMLAASSKK